MPDAFDALQEFLDERYMNHGGEAADEVARNRKQRLDNRNMQLPVGEVGLSWGQSETQLRKTRLELRIEAKMKKLRSVA